MKNTETKPLKELYIEETKLYNKVVQSSNYKKLMVIQEMIVKKGNKPRHELINPKEFDFGEHI